MDQPENSEVNKNQHFASKYFSEIDEASETDNYFAPVLKELPRYLDIKKAKVLDVGCGTGVFMKSLIDSGCSQFHGIDGFSEFANRALERGYQEVKIIDDLNISKIPYDDNLFDLVICKDVFEHLLNPIHVLKEMQRVLKPNGLLLLHVPNQFTLSGRVRFLISNNIDTYAFFKGESRWTFPHIRFYEYKDSLEVLKENKFTLIENLSYHFADLPVLGRFSILKSTIRSLAKSNPNQFASGFTFLARKNND